MFVQILYLLILMDAIGGRVSSSVVANRIFNREVITVYVQHEVHLQIQELVRV